MLQPLLWGLCFIFFGLLTKSIQKRKRRVWIGLFILFIFSNQALFFEVSNAWEIKPIAKELINQNEYEVAIILGGISTYDHKHQSLEFNANSDRLMKVIPLYFSGVVKKILFSGGSGKLNSADKESHFIREYLIELGIKPEDIITEENSRNTYENVKFSTQIIKDRKISGNMLLSTSSTHMFRSKLCFDKIEFDVQMFPTDQIAINREINPSTLFVPKPGTLNHWHNLIHEWVGILVYKVRGYC
jgi:uncharacterized SAM-binding protein YcdF (DUF218 family)